MNIFDSIVHQLNEADYKDVVRKQRSVNRLFPDWADKVKGIAKMGGLRMKSSNPEEWYFQVHSGTEKDTWYDVHLQFKNVKELLAKYVKDRRIWVKDKTRIDRRKLAKKMLYNMDIAFSCSCPAAQYWGPNYITSLPKYAAKYGEPETRAPKIRNPKQYGMVCKHLQNIINVLPFYETTMSQWLKEFYEEDIVRIEQEASKEAGQFKQAGAALGKKIEEPEKPVKEPIKPTMKARPRVKKTKKPEIPTMKTALVKKKLKDKGIGQTKESLSESLNWQKTGTHTSSLLIGKYNITLRPNRSTSKADYGKSYSIFIEEAWPGEKNVWKAVETIDNVGSYKQARVKAEEWLRSKGLLENNIIDRKESVMDGKTKQVKESNTFQISSSNSAGDLQILSSKGVKYKFFGVNPPAKEKIEKLLRHKAYGKAWQMLKGFEMEKM